MQESDGETAASDVPLRMRVAVEYAKPSALIAETLPPSERTPVEIIPAELPPSEIIPAELPPPEIIPAELTTPEIIPAELTTPEIALPELAAVAEEEDSLHEAKIASEEGDPLSNLPPFERAVSIMRANDPPERSATSTEEPGKKALFFRLMGSIPPRLHPILLGVTAVLLAGMTFTLFHVMQHATIPSKNISSSSHNDKSKGVQKVSPPTREKKGSLPAKHHLDGMEQEGVDPGIPDAAPLSKGELQEIKAAVPTTCSVHGEKVLKWSFYDGYLLCVVKLKKSVGSYVLQRDDSGYTYLGGLIEAPNKEGIAELGVPTQTAERLVSHYNTL